MECEHDLISDPPRQTRTVHGQLRTPQTCNRFSWTPAWRSALHKCTHIVELAEGWSLRMHLLMTVYITWTGVDPRSL